MYRLYGVCKIMYSRYPLNISRNYIPFLVLCLLCILDHHSLGEDHCNGEFLHYIPLRKFLSSLTKSPNFPNFHSLKNILFYRRFVATLRY